MKLNLPIFLFLFIKVISEDSLIFINTDEEITIRNMHLNEQKLFYIKTKSLLPNKYYKIMVHYLGSLGISFKIKIICDDIHNIIKQNDNIKLNDFDEYDFKTNDKNIPTLCGENYNNNLIILSLEAYSRNYQLVKEEDIVFNSILEVISNKVNTDNKPINILTNKGLYKALIIILVVIPLTIFIFRYKIQKFLANIVKEDEYNVVKNK